MAGGLLDHAYLKRPRFQWYVAWATGTAIHRVVGRVGQPRALAGKFLYRLRPLLGRLAITKRHLGQSTTCAPRGLDGRVHTHQRVVAHPFFPHPNHGAFIIKNVVFLAEPHEAARHNQTRGMVVSLKIVAQP